MVLSNLLYIPTVLLAILFITYNWMKKILSNNILQCILINMIWMGN